MGLEEIVITLLYCGEDVMYNQWFGNLYVGCLPPVFASLLFCSTHLKQIPQIKNFEDSTDRTRMLLL